MVLFASSCFCLFVCVYMCVYMSVCLFVCLFSRGFFSLSCVPFPSHTPMAGVWPVWAQNRNKKNVRGAGVEPTPLPGPVGKARNHLLSAMEKDQNFEISDIGPVSVPPPPSPMGRARGLLLDQRSAAHNFVKVAAWHRVRPPRQCRNHSFKLPASRALAGGRCGPT